MVSLVFTYVIAFADPQTDTALLGSESVPSSIVPVVQLSGDVPIIQASQFTDGVPFSAGLTGFLAAGNYIIIPIF